MLRTSIFFLVIFPLCLAASSFAENPPLPLNAPFATLDQSPLIRIYGIPRPTAAQLPPDGTTTLSSSLDIASLYVVKDESGEELTFDGEVWRLTVGGLRSFGDYALGMEVPLIDHFGGIFDATISKFHRVLNLPEGNRNTAENNQISYQYRPEHGQNVTLLDDNRFGLGDIALMAGYQLPVPTSVPTLTSSLWLQLELPTGSADSLTGSESFDASTWCAVSLPIGKRLTLFGTAGGLMKSQGELLTEQEERTAGFSTLGVAWLYSESLALKLQGDFHTRLFKSSQLSSIGKNSAQSSAGFSWNISKKSRLDVSFTEDIYVESAPDIALHLSYSRQL